MSYDSPEIPDARTSVYAGPAGAPRRLAKNHALDHARLVGTLEGEDFVGWVNRVLDTGACIVARDRGEHPAKGPRTMHFVDYGLQGPGCEWTEDWVIPLDHISEAEWEVHLAVLDGAERAVGRLVKVAPGTYGFVIAEDTVIPLEPREMQFLPQGSGIRPDTVRMDGAFMLDDGWHITHIPGDGE